MLAKLVKGNLIKISNMPKYIKYLSDSGVTMIKAGTITENNLKTIPSEADGEYSVFKEFITSAIPEYDPTRQYLIKSYAETDDSITEIYTVCNAAIEE